MRWFVCLLLLTACGEPSSKDAEDEPTETDEAETDEVVTDAPTDAPTDVPPPLDKAIEGRVTWTITPNNAAANDGYEPCSYTRNYVGTLDMSVPWLCPDCDEIYLVDVTLDPGDEDCPAAYDIDVSERERIGFHDGQWYRGIQEFGAVGARGPLVVDGDRRDVSQSFGPVQISGGGKYSGEVSGSLTVTEVPGEPPEALQPASTYACGWDHNPAPPYTGDYQTAVGQPLPDGVLVDTCGEAVRIHHLLGRWLLIDASAANCGPCQTMAEGAQDAIDTLRGEGIDVEMVTVLAYDLWDPGIPIPPDIPGVWAQEFGITGPVLADRGWGQSTMLVPLGTNSFPTLALVDPSGIVVETISGFPGWKPIKNAIRDHAAP